MNPGEQFNPSRKACGFYPPDVVARQRDLGDGPKRLYERLVRWAGPKGTCWYGFTTMADALGKCIRQVKADLKALEDYGLVTHTRNGKRLANKYGFLWHPIFDGDVQSTALHPESDVQDTTGDVQDPALGDVQSTAHELCNQNHVKRITSSSAADAAWMTDAIARYGYPVTMRNYTGEEPPSLIVKRCLEASRGVSREEIAGLLEYKCKREGLQPGRGNGPTGWGWFPAVIANGLKGRAA